jgi:hypothetical protein
MALAALVAYQITYAVNGKRYVALVVGLGGFHAASYAPLVPELKSPTRRPCHLMAQYAI